MRGRTFLYVLGLLLIGVALGGLICRHRTSTELLDRVLIKLHVREAPPPPPPPPSRRPISPRTRLPYKTLSANPFTPFQGVKSPQNPIWLVRPGLDVERVAGGFSLPVGIVFAENSGADPSAPWIYVGELHGNIKYIARDRSVHTYARGLNDFENAKQDFLSDESGIVGIATIPGTEDLLITQPHLEQKSGLLTTRVVRLISAPGGRKMSRSEIVLDIDEYTAPSHQIQQVTVGPDGKVYVGLGDGRAHENAANLEKYGGKILRMNLDGTPCDDNPFYRPNVPLTPSQFVFASGLRNPHDFDFDPLTAAMYASDIGPWRDRLVKVIAGANYGWNGDDVSMKTNALYSWGSEDPAKTPTGLRILRHDALGTDTTGRMYLAMYIVPHPNATRKRQLLELRLQPSTGLLAANPEAVLEYAGNKKACILGLAEGPDGLYFTDFFGDSEGTGQDYGHGHVWRLYPSAATSNLPTAADEDLAKLDAPGRGAAYFVRTCVKCHSVSGEGGHEGPDLTHARETLRRKLNERGYLAQLDSLKSETGTFAQAQIPRIDEVLAMSEGDVRTRVWLKHHLEEPRFDNPHAKMPSMLKAYSDKQRNDIIEFVLTLD